MKRFSAKLFGTLVTGFYLVACGNPAPLAPTVTPIITDMPALTMVNPTVIAPPTIAAEPSITPSASFDGMQVSFDQLSFFIPTGVAVRGSGTIVPEAKKDEVAPWDVAPEHIQFILNGYALEEKYFPPQIYVYPAQAYVQLQERGAAALSLEQLGVVLAQSSMVNIKELPSVPFFNISPALIAQVKVIPFQNGRGVRMITQYAMGRGIINNYELFYHFEGLTDDGQYYVIVILPLTAPGLPEDGQPGGDVPPGGVPVPDFNDMNANWLGYLGDVRQMLQGLEPSAFNPALDQLDTLIASLTITTSD
jgi:hypothetical protein